MRVSLRLTSLPVIAAALAFAQFKPVTPPPQRPQQQPQPAPQDHTFSIEVRLVRLLASVKDQFGAPVTTLNKEDFRLADSGVPQTISVFERNTSLPLSIAVLIDTSASTNIELHNEESSLLHFVHTLLDAGNQQDAFALFSFNWRINMELDYSRSAKGAEHVLHGLKGEGGTSMYDAMYLASDTLKGREGRHAMVVITDGGDTTSYRKYEEALRAAQQADTVLYPVVVIPIEGDAGRNLGGEHALATLANSTGGRIFYPSTPENLDAAFSDILKELRTQYLLGYYPKGVEQQSRRYHPVSVKVNEPALRIASRSGYFEP